MTGQEYVAQVAAQLADLPDEDRAALLEDVAAHIAELEREEGALDRLGTAASYAAELRAAAGLPTGPPSARFRLPGVRLDGRVRTAFARALMESRTFLPQLRPAWWVLRGILLVEVVALHGVDGNDDFPFPTLLGSHALGAVALLAAVIGSVALGRVSLGSLRTRRPVAAAVALGNAALLVVAGNLFADASWRMSRVEYLHVSDPAPDSPLTSRFGPVTNLLPYDVHGRPLEGVLLYDQDGRPLRVAMQEWWPDRCARTPAHPAAADGVPVENSFPLRYELQLRHAPAECATAVSRPRPALPTFAPSATSKPSPSGAP